MAIKKILSYPGAEAVLKAKSLPVLSNDPELPRILSDLKDTLLATPNGVGLAAPQIGVLKRIFVLRKDYIIDDLDKNSALFLTPGQILVFINPKIISRKGVVHEEEGCLSVPETYVLIERAAVVKVRADNDKGEQFSERLKGLAARAVQQEIDHLDGLLILDRRKQELL